MSLYNEQSLDEIIINCPNPRCNEEIESTIAEIIRSRRVNCRRCRSQIEFNSLVISNLKSEMSKIERLKEDIMRNAKVNIRG